MKRMMIACAVIMLGLGVLSPTEAMARSAWILPFIVEMSGNNDSIFHVRIQAVNNRQVSLQLHRGDTGGILYYETYHTMSSSKELIAFLASDIVDLLSSGDQALLEYDIDGDGTNDNYVGLMMLFTNPESTEGGYSLVSAEELTVWGTWVDLPGGYAANLGTFVYTQGGHYDGKQDVEAMGVQMNSGSNANFFFVLLGSETLGSEGAPTIQGPRSGTSHIYIWNIGEECVSKDIDLSKVLSIVRFKDIWPQSWLAYEYPWTAVLDFAYDPDDVPASIFGFTLERFVGSSVNAANFRKIHTCASLSGE